MLKINNINKENFRNKILNNLNQDTDLNINTSSNSFVYKIMDALSETNKDKIDIINKLVENNNIQNLSNVSLDNFFSLFNIKRLKYSDGIFELEFYYYGDDYFKILSNHIFEINNKNYLSIETIEVNKEKNNYKIKLKEMTNTNLKLTSFYEIDNVKINSEGLLVNVDKIEIFKKNLKDNTVVNNFSLLETNRETDESFLNRGTNLFQNMSSDSNFKIISEIKNIENVFDAYSFEEYLTTYIVVIPSKINFLEDVMKYSEEIIEFFKNKNTKLLKPNYVNFSIYNLKNKIPDKYYNQINTYIKSMIKTIYLNDNKFVRNDFINDLNNYIKSLKIELPNLNDIEIKYKIYLECDLDLLFESNKIYNNNIKTFQPSIFVCEDVM